MTIEALLFDKDGTLYDFQSTWAPFGLRAVEHFSDGDERLAAELAAALGLDVSGPRFLPHSVVIAGSSEDVAMALEPLFGADAGRLVDGINDLARDVTPVEAVPLRGLMASLHAQDIPFGVATNDSEEAARENLRKTGILGLVPFIAGYDSGFGAKPGTGMCEAFLEKFDLAPHRAAMVGDSLHDLKAGRSAGMQTIGVLTGVATREDLAPFADWVLNDIGEILPLLD